MFGCGSVAQIVLSRGSHGRFLTVNLAFGFAVTLGILIAGQVSGMCRDLYSTAPPKTHLQMGRLGLSSIAEGGFPNTSPSNVYSPWDEFSCVPNKQKALSSPVLGRNEMGHSQNHVFYFIWKPLV